MRRLSIILIVLVLIASGILAWQMLSEDKPKQIAQSADEFIDREYERIYEDWPPEHPRLSDREFREQLGEGLSKLEFKREILLRLLQAKYEVIDHAFDRVPIMLGPIDEGQNGWEHLENALDTASSVENELPEIIRLLKAGQEPERAEDKLEKTASLHLMRYMADNVVKASSYRLMYPEYPPTTKTLAALPTLATLLVLYARHEFSNWIDDAHEPMAALWNILTRDTGEPSFDWLQQYAEASAIILEGARRLIEDGDLTREEALLFVNPIDIRCNPYTPVARLLSDCRTETERTLDAARESSEAALDEQLGNLYPGEGAASLEQWVEKITEETKTKCDVYLALAAAMDREALRSPSPEWLDQNLELLRKYEDEICGLFQSWRDDIYFVGIRARFGWMADREPLQLSDFQSELDQRPHVQVTEQNGRFLLRIDPEHPLNEFIPEECLKAVLVLEPID